MSYMSGYFLGSPKSQNIDWAMLEDSDGIEATQLGFRRTGPLYGSKLWQTCEVDSFDPLMDEVEGPRRDNPYRYRVVCAISGARIIILAERKRIVDHLLFEILSDRFFPNLRKIQITLDRLIDACAAPGAEYLVTSLHGRFSGADRKVRVMSLYGDDLTDTPLFRDYGKAFNFFSCGLGKRLYDGLPRLRPPEEAEVCRLGNDGFLSLNLTDLKRARDLARILNYVIKNRWVETWVPPLEIKDEHE